jgi:hypothetical protein
MVGVALWDQGGIVTAVLDAGCSPEQVRRIVAGRPLPDLIRSSEDAIVAAHARPPPPAPMPRL